MKSRLTISLLLICCTFNLYASAYSNFNITDDLSPKKVYIILRSEQNPDQLLAFKYKVENNLQYNNVTSQIETFKVNQAIPQMKIFKTAYEKNFDYILLIDEITKYNVGISSKKINVGSKFRIQSYHLKCSNPEWKNLGNTNCNPTVDESVHEFSKKLLIGIATDSQETLQSYVSIDYNPETKTSSISETEKVQQIQLLKTKIKLQKAKTKRVLTETEILILETEKQLLVENEKHKKLLMQLEELKQ